MKSIFVPDTEVLGEKINDLTSTFKSKFGIDTVDLTGILGSDVEVSDITGNITVYNTTVSGTFFNSYALVKAVDTFRPYIRGFIALMLVLYNINQFLHFIGAGGITLGNNKEGEE